MDELQAVVALWELDKGIARAEEALVRLDGSIAAATARIAEIAAERAEIRARQQVLTDEERGHQRKLDDALTRKRRTQELIDQGLATDYITATRQVATAAAMAEELEGQILVIMEEQEQLVERLEGLQRSDTLAAARQREAELDRDAAVPGIKAEIAQLTTAREAAWELLPVADRSRYKILRAQGLRPVAPIVGGACNGCRQNVPFQVLNELKRGVKAHTCRGCNRWLLVDEGASA